MHYASRDIFRSIMKSVWVHLGMVAFWAAVPIFLASCKPGTNVATPAAQPAAKPELSALQKAGVAFVKAAEADDMVAMHNAAVGTEPEFALAKGFGAMMRSVKQCEAAAIAKFGDDGKLPPDKTRTLDVAAAFESAAEEKIEGDKGTLILLKDTPIEFKKVGDSWKIDLKFLDNDPHSEEVSRMLPKQALLLDTIKQEIEADKYQRARYAWAALQDRWDESAGQGFEKKVKDDIAKFDAALARYQNDVGDYPLVLDALLTKPANESKWKGPYLTDSLPRDPWGHPYSYAYPGQHNPTTYDLWSKGDGKRAITGLDNWTPAGSN